MTAQSAPRRWLVTIGLIGAVVALLAVPLIISATRSTGGPEQFVGTDAQATSAIEQSHPGYRPWAHALFNPSSPEVESGLFAVQAALGAGALGYVLGRLHGRGRQDRL